MENTTTVSAATTLFDPTGTYTLTTDVTLNTINNANLTSATVYINANPNIAFDSANPSGGVGYEAKPATVSGKRITLNEKVSSGVVYAIVMATDANGVKYLACYNPKWDMAAGKWTASGATQRITDASNIIDIGYIAASYLPNYIQLSDLNIGNVNASYPYTGSAIAPIPTVELVSNSVFNSTGSPVTLTAGTHYTASYSANTNVGTAKITLTFKNPYMGVAEKTFAIVAKPLAGTDVTVSLSQPEYGYTGNPIKPGMAVSAGGKFLTEGVDYTITYNTDSTSIGTHKATLTFKGNYSGSKEVTYKIVDSTDAFMVSYLGGTTNPYKTATADNFQEILNGEVTYNSMGAPLQALINGKLAPTTYPDLLNEAKVIGFQTNRKPLLDKTVATKDDVANINAALAEINSYPATVQAKLTNEKAKLTTLLNASQYMNNNDPIISKATITASDEAALNKALSDYEALDASSKALIDSDVLAKLNVKKDAMKFLKDNSAILSKDKADLTTDDMDAIQAVLDEYSELSGAVSSTIDDSVKDLLGDFSSFVKESEFIKTYVSDKAATMYKDADASNYEQILSGKDTWDAITQDQKDAINLKLTDHGGKTYEDLIAGAKAIQDQATDFIDTYVTDKDGNVYADVTADNFDQIYSGTDPVFGNWAALDANVRTAINEALMNKVGKTYDEMITETETMIEGMENFVETYLVDAEDNLYTEVTPSNYQQILSGKAD